MYKLISIFSLLTFITLSSCNIQPQPINYGEDACHFCKMNIIDKQHAAQIVTSKGKAFKFDATECMLNHIKEIDKKTIALYLVADYNDPGSLIDAKTAKYIISENIPSPMGEYLSATKTNEDVLELQKNKTGNVYNWEELLAHFNEK